MNHALSLSARQAHCPAGVSVKSAANCAACHTRASQGQYDDDNLRVPPGLDARLRRAWTD